MLARMYCSLSTREHVGWTNPVRKARPGHTQAAYLGFYRSPNGIRTRAATLRGS
jgi:hypothetical protein